MQFDANTAWIVEISRAEKMVIQHANCFDYWDDRSSLGSAGCHCIVRCEVVNLPESVGPRGCNRVASNIEERRSGASRGQKHAITLRRPLRVLAGRFPRERRPMGAVEMSHFPPHRDNSDDMMRVENGYHGVSLFVLPRLA